MTDQESTVSSIAPVTITATPVPTSAIASSTSSPTPSSEAPKSQATVPVAAVVAPVVIVLIAVVGFFGFLFWRRKQRAHKASPNAPPLAEVPYNPASSHTYSLKNEPSAHGTPTQYYAHTRDTEPAVAPIRNSDPKIRYELDCTEKVEAIEMDSGSTIGLKNGEKKSFKYPK